jgi:integrase
MATSVFQQKCCHGVATNKEATMRKRLTDRTIKSLKPASAAAAPSDVMDTIVPGFGVRIMGTPQHPVRTYILRTRFPGSTNPTRVRIGSYDETDKMSLEGAREKARDWLALIRKGRDPRIEEQRRREAELRKHATLFGAVAEDFIRDKLPGERRGADVEREIRKEFKTWWDRPIADITDEDVIRIIRAKAKTAPASARNILGHAKRVFQWAIDQRAYGFRVSPASDIKPTSIVGEKVARDRLLDDDEVFAFWRAARMPYPAGPVFRLLILTGLRLTEVSNASWSEFNPVVVRAIRQRGDKPVDWNKFDQQQLTWTIPASRMKGKNGKARAHVVPLTIDMLRILEGLPIFVSGGEFLFSRNAGRRPAVMSTEIKDDLDARMLRTLRAMARQRGDDPAGMKLKPWVQHDLRRVVRSGLSQLKIAEEIREAVLAHARPGIKGVYDQHDYLDEKRDALQLWGARLRGIVEPSPAVSNVVAMRPAS